MGLSSHVDFDSSRTETFARFIRDAGGDVPGWLGVWTDQRYIDRDLLPLKAPDPLFDEPSEAFEWADLLNAVMGASRTFSMVELGAGWGRWTMNAAAACRRWGGLRYRLVAIEGEPTHAQWARRHRSANGVRRFGRAGSCRVIRAAVGDKRGIARFAVGSPSRWYGQALVDGTWTPEQTRWVRTIKLSSLIRSLGHVDFVHADIQGAELAVFTEAASILGRVDRIHIATHNAEVESGLRTLFRSLGFDPVWDVACGSEVITASGREVLVDGIQGWRRPA